MIRHASATLLACALFAVGLVPLAPAAAADDSAAAAPACYTLAQGFDFYYGVCVYTSGSCTVYVKHYTKDNDMSRCVAGAPRAGGPAVDVRDPICWDTRDLSAQGYGVAGCFAFIGGCYLYVVHSSPLGTQGRCLWHFTPGYGLAASAPEKECVTPIVAPDYWVSYCVDMAGECKVGQEGYTPGGSADKCYVAVPEVYVVQPEKRCVTPAEAPDYSVSYCVDVAGECKVGQEGYTPSGRADRCYVAASGPRAIALLP